MNLEQIQRIIDPRIKMVPKYVEPEFYWSLVIVTSALNQRFLDVQKRAIDSILENTTKDNFELIIIENNSTGSLLRQFTDFCFTRMEQYPGKIKYTYVNEPFNQDRLFNLGFNMGRGTHIAICCADIEVKTKGWLEVAEKWFTKNKEDYENGLVPRKIGILTFPSNIRAEFQQTAPDWWREDSSWKFNHALREELVYEKAYFWCLLLPRDFLNEIGGCLDERYISWCNDYHLYGIMYHFTDNYTSAIAYDALVDHVHPGTYICNQKNPKKQYYLTQYNKGIWAHRWHTLGFFEGPVCYDCTNDGHSYVSGGIISPKDYESGIRCKFDNHELKDYTPRSGMNKYAECPECGRIYMISEGTEYICPNNINHKEFKTGDDVKPAAQWLGDEYKDYYKRWLAETDNGTNVINYAK